MKKIKREITRFIVVGQLKFTGETKVGWRFAGSSSSKGGRRRWWWFLRRGGGEEAGDCIVIYGQTWSSTANRPFDINFLSISASFLFQFPRACSMDILQVFVTCGEGRGRGGGEEVSARKCGGRDSSIQIVFWFNVRSVLELNLIRSHLLKLLNCSSPVHPLIDVTWLSTVLQQYPSRL